MKISKNWLEELVDLNTEELIRLLPLRTIALKEVTEDYIELDMKGYNRADLLSLRGVAFETAAITGSKVKFKDKESSFPELDKVDVEITDENLCPVYCVAKIENLKVGDSDATWVKKLNDSGIRSVNNIADVTNLTMLEYGQPLHAFDANTLKSEKIIVRSAKTDEEIVTLDNKKRKLKPADLLIADPEKALGIAGVMGGKNSEVSGSTTSILLEAAIFDPINLRNTVTRLGLQSEAGKRFQHGLTKKRLLQAFDAAIKMYENLGGKVTAITLTGNLKDKEKTIKLSREKVNSLIGIDIPSEEVKSSLQKLGFAVKDWEVTVPYFRLDVNIEEDVIEEIARMHGYEKIPAKPLGNNVPTAIQNPIFDLIEKLKQALVDLGLTEVQTYSYYSTKVIKNFKLEIKNLVRIANPMSAETEYLRKHLWPNLLEVTAKNIRQGYKDIAIFEIGKVYYPKEEYHLSIALLNGTDNPIQELNRICQSAHLEGGFVATPGEYFHPTRRTNGMAEIHPRFVNKFGIEQRVAVLEIGLNKLL
ncbi:MAG: phenylalanine--tRNA ligase subunit beta [Candidatus Daviesbacteria bacterium]|nr:phenylalanine--tRNA ligase subunit beta [Candidatus Daviesbacteria bacterium]